MTRSIHRLAAEDLAQAVRFYQNEAGAGLARRFLNEFERVAQLLEQHPGLGTPTADGRRAHPLSDFPYSLIYRHEGLELRILVVRHQSRDPEHGAGRR
ncbi:plasmid stabilization system protein [Serpentinimonas raichei]|uniref:Plasmid stabilization system protein n=1 Tax=Serpentinimonas raichei TaxID=1458425 RepID=A0A060NFJ6_9BURK|nr:type II toxin-antitoxin system RelE/ParE family toxin [Serpentinimonas raichei]BAO80226.1 plasmid stabilization system protein [Serpentinimonas raichei]